MIEDARNKSYSHFYLFIFYVIAVLFFLLLHNKVTIDMLPVNNLVSLP